MCKTLMTTFLLVLFIQEHVNLFILHRVQRTPYISRQNKVNMKFGYWKTYFTVSVTQSQCLSFTSSISEHESTRTKILPNIREALLRQRERFTYYLHMKYFVFILILCFTFVIWFIYDDFVDCTLAKVNSDFCCANQEWGF